MNMPEDLKEELRGNILTRLRKIEGQVRGLQGMVSAGKECEQILTQLRAARAALNAVTTLVFKSYLAKCWADLGPDPAPEKVFRQMEQTVSLLTKFLGD